jgi:hypothetical protein
MRTSCLLARLHRSVSAYRRVIGLGPDTHCRAPLARRRLLRNPSARSPAGSKVKPACSCLKFKTEISPLLVANIPSTPNLYGNSAPLTSSSLLMDLSCVADVAPGVSDDDKPRPQREPGHH